MQFSWRGNWAYKVISVALALGLWFFVTEEHSPVASNVINVPLETRNLSQGLVVAEKQSEVVVRVQGERERVNSLTSRDIRAFVSLQGARLGKNVQAVQVTLPPRVELVEVTPEQASLIVEEVQKKQLPVEVQIKGQPAAGFTALKPVLHPDAVVVSGAQSWLNRLGRAFVEAEVSGLRGNFHAYLPVRLADRNGYEESTGRGVDPLMVEVFIPVIPAGPSKEVPVKVTLEGNPADGVTIRRVTVNPATLRVYGSQDVLSQLTQLISLPVDISGLKQDIQMPLDFNPPAGVYIEPVAAMAQIEVNPVGH